MNEKPFEYEENGQWLDRYVEKSVIVGHEHDSIDVAFSEADYPDIFKQVLKRLREKS